MEHQQPSLAPPPSAPASSSGKAPVVRGARACTVCRQAKMRCIGADDGARACQRCKKGNLECVFEKHRRGRKPGSKLSEASKMLRRLEKGLSNAKLKSQASTSASQMPFPVSASRTVPPSDAFASHGSSSNGGDVYMEGTGPQLQQHMQPSYQGSSQSQEYPQMAYPQPRGAYPPNPEQLAAEPANDSMSGEEDEDDDHDSNDKSDDGLFPSRLLAKERRHSFFRTILNPSDPAGEENHPEPGSSPGIDRKDGLHDSPLMTPTIASVPGLDDPISAGLIDEADAKVLFDLVFLRLNPFINLFDPVLHTVAHVRSRCPFLFTCLIMAGTKFWKPELYKKTQKLAIDFSVRAFQDAWKRVEVVQAFACLTYWKEPDDTRTWTYIGYACRLAVELNLNRYVSHPPENETEHQKRERRNRERTYLVLFVHDRSLSMQTGRQWMLPEDDLVRHSSTWHEDNFIRPEDVIVSAFVQLRRIAAETTDVFYLNRDRGSPGSLHADVNYEILLHGCNGKLTHWMETWQGEMKKASGNQPFHFSMLSFFRLHVRLFLNSFGLQSSMAAASRASPSLQALSACYTSALQTLQIVTNEFAPVGMLRYGQDSITVMTAYSAVFLLRLLRRTNTLTELNEGAAHKIYELITQTADAYQEAAILAASSSSAAYHARFLRTLVARDMTHKARVAEREKRRTLDSMSNGGMSAPGSDKNSPAFVNSPTSRMPSAQGPMSLSPSITNSSAGFTNGQQQANGHMNGQQQQQQQPMTNGHAFHPPGMPADRNYAYTTSPHHHGHSLISPADNANNNPFDSMQGQPQFQPQAVIPQQGITELDAHYWRHMFVELGFSSVDVSQAGDNGGNNASFFADPMQAAGAATMMNSSSLGMVP